MRCRHCGFENQSGTYRCQKCGNSLLPPLPRDVYHQDSRKALRRTEKKVRQIVFSAAAFLIILTVSSLAARIFASTRTAAMHTLEAAAVEEDSSTEEDSFMELDISGDSLQLPDSDISVGLPAYVNYTSSYQTDSQSPVHIFELEGGFIMKIHWMKMDYPFTKSAEEDYFMEDLQYDRLEGQEEQYFILQSDDRSVTATVVDRPYQNQYSIQIYPAAENASIQKARQIMNQTVIDQSSLVRTG